MNSVEFICPECGRSFTRTGLIIPGVTGFLNTLSGPIFIIDPDESHRCPKCCEEMIAQLRLCMEE